MGIFTRSAPSSLDEEIFVKIARGHHPINICRRYEIEISDLREILYRGAGCSRALRSAPKLKSLHYWRQRIEVL